MKPVIIILSVIALGLGVTLLVVHQQKERRLAASQQAQMDLIGRADETTTRLTESEQLNDVLRSRLTAREQELAATSNLLARTQADLGEAKSEVETAQTELRKQQTRIGELEGQRGDLTKQMDALNHSITTLEMQMAETRKKLASAEGDRDFLLKELQRLQEEKAALVAQFNNLAALKTQVAKLKEEAAIKLRQEWKRSGVYARREQKGAEALLVKASPFLPRPDHRLDVEIEQDGTGRVVPAPPAATQ